MMTNKQGFTLIEILIVIAILGIIATFAFPAYQNQMASTRRAEGIALLNQIMQAQEREYVDSRTYQTDLRLLGYAADPVVSEKGYYQVVASACGGSITVCVQLTATGIGVQSGTEDLTLNSRGSKSGF